MLLLSMCWVSCMRTHLSRILDKNGRLETGLKLLRSFGSEPFFFFSNGVTWPILRQSGMTPVLRELFIILVQSGPRVSLSFLASWAGIGSEMCVEGLE